MMIGIVLGHNQKEIMPIKVQHPLDPGELKAKLARITPEIAEELLQKNNHNRSINWGRVRQYAEDIKSDYWSLNGEAIKICIDGEILDGQHRLLAIIEADQAVDTLLITGLPLDSQETMDQGQPRNFSDTLKLRGERNYTTLASACRMLFFTNDHGIPVAYGSNNNEDEKPKRATASVKQLSRILKQNSEIRKSVQFAVENDKDFLRGTQVAGLHYLFSSVDQDSADDFFLKLSSGDDLKKHDPIYICREKLIKEKMREEERRLTTVYWLVYVIKTWNAYYEGTPLTRLTYTPGGAHPEKFPAIAGLIGKDD